MTTVALDPLVQEAYEKLQEIQRKVDEFFDKVNSVLSWVPFFLSYLIEPIRAAIEALNAKLREFWDRANQLMEQPGSPSALKDAAQRWSSEVTAPGQVAGLNGAKGVADQMRSSLTSLAMSVENFWLAIGIAFATFIVSAV